MLAKINNRGHQSIIKRLNEKGTILKEKTNKAQPRATKANEGIK